MPTKTFKLSSVPQQIADGTEQVFIQSNLRMPFKLIESATEPTDTSDYILVRDSITAPAGYSLWAVNESGGIDVEVTVMTKSG